jgi:DNA helicase HerA-like ATPase
MKNDAGNNVPVDVQGLEARSGDLRAIQDYLEDRAMRNVAQVAYSTDGRTFGFEAPLSLSIPVGSFVHLKAGNSREYLGQIITKELVQREGAEISLGFDEKDQGIVPEWVAASGTRSRLRIRALEGSGVLLGKVAGDDLVATSNVDTFQKATITQADMALVDRYLAGPARKRASLLIGHALYMDGHVPVWLDAGGLNRHTFLCGQSGSGKTFSLGIVLERLLLETNLRMVIIDPNSDFVRFDRVRLLRIFRPAALAARGEHPLRVRFGDLSPREQGTVLDLDPLADREEFNAFWRLVERLGHQNYSWDEVREAIGRDYTAQVRQLGLRIENLGIAGWEVWCPPGEPSLLDALGQEDWRGLVLDIGTLGSSVEKSVIANAILTHLWEQRNQRQPLLIVIDEAHNLCPQEPADDMQAISTEAVIRIAGEGRKFGLYLLLASQRPNKIHSHVLSQCDNLLLMRMNSHSDLAHLASILSQVPTSLMGQATKFSIGESLLAGRIVQNPTFAKFEGRLSVEGGGDIPTTWAARRD